MANQENIRLTMLGLPVVQSLNDLSERTRISKNTIYQFSHNANKYYKTFTIPKKSGGLRVINQPSKNLKGLQSWILRNILDKLSVSNSCKGFEKGQSIVNNVSPHKGASTILTIDLKNFFPSINGKLIYSIFFSLGYNKFISTILTNICTINNCLPQGSPCSPKLANLVAWKLDLRLQGYIGKKGLTYTRYADDLTFSGLNPSKVVQTISTVRKIIESENFKINYRKMRIAGPAKSKIITGLTLYDDNFGIGRKKYKLLRSKIHHLTIEEEQTNTKLLSDVKGWLAYLKNVDILRYKQAKSYIKELQRNHPTTLIKEIQIGLH
jgi:RNA-directed DNA polymerase